MNNQYYSVEEISKIIGMHPKTIARYIREGKLPANKVGKEWRISGHDLSVFVEGHHSKPSADSYEVKPITVTAVVDIPGTDKDTAMRIANTLTAAANSKGPEAERASVSTQYIAAEGMLRVMLWGSLQFTEVMMGTISALTQEGREDEGYQSNEN